MRSVLKAILGFGALGALIWLERRRPLRATTESKLVRDSRNLAAAALAGSAIQLFEKPVVQPLSALVERRRWGLLKHAHLPAWAEVPISMALLDYTLYIWHVLTHRVPLLWRFHAVHHVDLDLDATTGLRFHFGEMILSVAWRAGQVLGIGPSPRALKAWQTALVCSILFHHSNLRLPIPVERVLNRFIVTPRMHGIHHSIIQEETNSNWSSGLTLWDRLHGTLRLNIPQQEITIGVPAIRQPQDATLPKILRMPFEEQKDLWLLPGDGKPVRPEVQGSNSQLSE